eukprot:Nk52_evm10s222 gene=Nk52_evmTU10s222
MDEPVHKSEGESGTLERPCLEETSREGGTISDSGEKLCILGDSNEMKKENEGTVESDMEVTPKNNESEEMAPDQLNDKRKGSDSVVGEKKPLAGISGVKRKKLKRIIQDDELGEEAQNAIKKEKERVERLKQRKLLSHHVVSDEIQKPAVSTSVNASCGEFGESSEVVTVHEEGSKENPLCVDDLQEVTSAVEQYPRTSVTWMGGKMPNRDFNKPTPSTQLLNAATVARGGGNYFHQPQNHRNGFFTHRFVPAAENYKRSENVTSIVKPSGSRREKPFFTNAKKLLDDDELGNDSPHTDDSLNVPEADGRVLVNNNRLENEKRVYLHPHIAEIAKPHQIGGIRFMFDNVIESVESYDNSDGFGCILAHSMGLGKTFQTIALVDLFLRETSGKTVLICAPVNTLVNWESEFEKWLSDDAPRVFSITDKVSGMRERTQLVDQWLQGGGVLIIGYEMFGKVVEVTSKGSGKFSTSRLLRPGPDLAICDEGHKIKNEKTRMSVVLKQLKTKRRICLTGYPLQNNLMEYWCMVDFVRPALLGNREEFTNRFERPIANGQCSDSRSYDIKLMKDRTVLLQLLLRSIVQRRDHNVLISALPPCHEIILPIFLSPVQEMMYKAYINSAEQRCLQTFAYFSKLWNHPDLLDPGNNETVVMERRLDPEVMIIDSDTNASTPGASTSSLYSDSVFPIDLENLNIGPIPAVESIEYKKDVIENSSKFEVAFLIADKCVELNEKVLLFSQSIVALNCFERFLVKRNVPGTNVKWKKNVSFFRIDGQVPVSERSNLINRFNDEENETAKLFLVSTRAGGIGVNLVGASRVIILDVSWNPCHDSQALCRVYRYGQKRETYVYRMFAFGTMEDVIYKRCVFKQGISGSVVDELNLKRNISSDEIRRLYSYTAPDRKAVHLPDYLPFNEPVLSSVYEAKKHLFGQVPFKHNALLEVDVDEALTKEDKKKAVQRFFDRAGNREPPEISPYGTVVSSTMISSCDMGHRRTSAHSELSRLQLESMKMKSDSEKLLLENNQNESVVISYNRNAKSLRPSYSVASGTNNSTQSRDDPILIISDDEEADARKSLCSRETADKPTAEREGVSKASISNLVELHPSQISDPPM